MYIPGLPLHFRQICAIFTMITIQNMQIVKIKIISVDLYCTHLL